MRTTTEEHVLSFQKDFKHFILTYIMIRFFKKKCLIAFLLVFCFQQRKINYIQFKKEYNLSIPSIK